MINQKDLLNMICTDAWEDAAREFFADHAEFFPVSEDEPVLDQADDGVYAG